jgi:hypothetical protein
MPVHQETMFQMNKILLSFAFSSHILAPKPPSRILQIVESASSHTGEKEVEKNKKEKKPNAENHSQLTSVIT